MNKTEIKRQSYGSNLPLSRLQCSEDRYSIQVKHIYKNYRQLQREAIKRRNIQERKKHN